ncbi:TPA: HipA domain-containing protein [Aeromonas hydrophila]
MTRLAVYLQGERAGTLHTLPGGALAFDYAPTWVANPHHYPLSWALPVRAQGYQGEVVTHFFENLLPDPEAVRARLQQRVGADSAQPADLLRWLGQDCVGAVQLLPEDAPAPVRGVLAYRPLSPQALSAILMGAASGVPLGMVPEVDTLRMTLPGAQDKTALLYVDGRWCEPRGGTPTTHLLKLPMGLLARHDYAIDLSLSVENEYLCALIARAFGLPVATCFMVRANQCKALAVARFDRRLAPGGLGIERVHQADLCQMLGVPSAHKYESHGGPGIADIMAVLRGSVTATRDRYLFMKLQVLFWLLAATDGHAKNVSVFIEPGGGYRLAPFYDILSLSPALGQRGLHPRSASLAMGLCASRGKKRAITHIFARHFYQTADAVGFEAAQMQGILRDVVQQAPAVVACVTRQLPADFPRQVSEPIFEGMLARARRLGLHVG